MHHIVDQSKTDGLILICAGAEATEQELQQTTSHNWLVVTPISGESASAPPMDRGETVCSASMRTGRLFLDPLYLLSLNYERAIIHEALTPVGETITGQSNYQIKY